MINETSETSLIVKLLKRAIDGDSLTQEELLTAHELYEDLKVLDGTFYGYKAKHDNFYPDIDD